MATTTYGSPYVQSSDLVSGWPTSSLAVADRVDDVSFKGNGVNDQVASYTGVLLDAGKTVVMNVAGANTFTIPTAATVAYENGTMIRVSNKGAGTTTVQPIATVTLNGGNITLLQYQSATIQLVAANVWNVVATPAPAAAASGLTFITSATWSAAGSVNVDNCFTSAYENYRLITYATGATGNLQMRLRASGSTISSANYNPAAISISSAGAVADFGSGTGNTFWYMGGSQPTVGLATEIYRPQLATITSMTNIQSGSTPGAHLTTGSFQLTTQCDGFSLFYASGTNSGTVKVYGYQNS